jgi:hypothetical protein
MGAGTIGAPARPLPQLLPTSNPYQHSTLEVRNSGKWYSNRSKSRPSGNRRLDWVSSIRTRSSKSTGTERNGTQRAISTPSGTAPVNRSAPETAGNLPLSGPPGQAESATRSGTGGGGGPRCEASQAPATGNELTRQVPGSEGDPALAQASCCCPTRTGGSEARCVAASRLRRWPPCRLSLLCPGPAARHPAAVPAPGLPAQARARARRCRRAAMPSPIADANSARLAGSGTTPGSGAVRR